MTRRFNAIHLTTTLPHLYVPFHLFRREDYDGCSCYPFVATVVLVPVPQLHHRAYSYSVPVIQVSHLDLKTFSKMFSDSARRGETIQIRCSITNKARARHFPGRPYQQRIHSIDTLGLQWKENENIRIHINSVGDALALLDVPAWETWK